MRLRLAAGGLLGGLAFGLVGLLASEVGRSVTHIPRDHPSGSPWRLFLHNGYLFVAALGFVLGAVQQWSSLRSGSGGPRVLGSIGWGVAVGVVLTLFILELGRGAAYIENSGRPGVIPMASYQEWLADWVCCLPILLFGGVGALLGLRIPRRRHEKS